MTGSPFLRRLLVPVALALVVVAVWLAFDNPDIDGTSRGDGYTCLAPWDTVLNGADNYPGGEPPPDGEQIASRCRTAGQHRFDLAVGSLVAAGLLVVLAAALPRREPRGERS